MRIRLERHVDGVAEVVLAAPERLNAIDPAWVAELDAALAALADGDRVVLLRAEGRSFCVGGDVASFVDGDDLGATVAGLAAALHTALRRLRALELPLVTAVHGWAAGAGCSLALLGDVVLLAEDARLKTAYRQLGLSPDGGMSWTLPRRVGAAVAADLLLTDRVLDAAEAQALGLASRVLPTEGFAAAAREVAAEVAAGAPGASRAVRTLLRASETASLDEQLDAEAHAIATQAAGPDGAEGIRAFLERRPAVFPSHAGAGPADPEVADAP